MQGIPQQYLDLYLQLRRQIGQFKATVADNWDGVKYAPASFGAECVPADNYKNLLSMSYYTQSVLPYLDRLAQLGCKSVKFQLGFPILSEAFWSGWVVPNGYDLNRLAAYRTRYALLVSDIHARGMKVIAQSQHMEISRGSSWNVAGYYATLDWSAYKAGRQANILEVAGNLGLSANDFLILQSEPDNEAAMTGQGNLVNVSLDVAMVSEFLAALDSAGLNTMVVGAGCGSWFQKYVEHVQALVALPDLNLIDVHVYPVNLAGTGGSFWQRFIALCEIARAAGKQLGCSESWVNKTRDSEVGVLLNDITFSRNVYSFFQALDIDFRAAMVGTGHWKQFAFQSASFSRQLFAYVDYNAAPNGTPAELDALQNQATLAAITAGSFSEGGLDYQRLIA
jgi:hypothetical protein